MALVCALSSTGAGVGCGGSNESTDHPRLWLTPDDLPRLRGWATAKNPVYQEGFVPLLQEAERLYSSEGQVDINGRLIESFFPPSLGGDPNPIWPDDGLNGVGVNRAETYAELFAFMSLVAPDAEARDAYGEKAKNLFMATMKKIAACGLDEGQPYCASNFPVFNRANYTGEAFGVTLDWIYPLLSKSDKKVVRKVFLRWADFIVKDVFFAPDMTLLDPPLDVSRGDNTQLLSNKWNSNNQRQFRWSANNYYSGSMRNLLLMVLAFDEADDPPVDGDQPKEALGNTLRSYIPYLMNVVLYQQYAMYEERQKVIEAYQLQSILPDVDGPGLASGGMPPEGFLYGHGLGYVLESLYAMNTAGYDNVKERGPQAALFRSGTWDTLLDGLIQSLARDPVPIDGAAYPSVYQMASFGDLLYNFMTDFDYGPMFATMALRHEALGDAEGKQKSLWALTSVLPGGPDYLTRNLANAFNTSGSSIAILAFMALDPKVPLSSYPDPRPSMPTTFVSRPFARVLSRTDWSKDASWFNHLCGWQSINHQNGECGKFELYRKGEWLTAGRSGYDNPVYEGGQIARLPYNYTPDYHNVLGIQNDLSQVDLSALGTDERASAERGGQWNNGSNTGDPVTLVSAADEQPYVFAQDVMTNLYNRIGNHSYDTPEGRASAVRHASRSVLWVKPDHVVVYDRATTGKQDTSPAEIPLFKRFNLLLWQKVGAAPAVAANEGGHVTTETTAGGQSLFIQTLLPAGATPQILDLEPQNPALVFDSTDTKATHAVRFRVEDPGTSSSDTRFLHVLQGADAGQGQDRVLLLTAGSAVRFEGAQIALSDRTVSAMFLRDLDQLSAFDAVTFSVPAGANEVYVTGLAPAATYHVQTGSDVTVSVSGGGSAMDTDEAGVLRVVF